MDERSSPGRVETLARDVRAIYRSDPPRADMLIEAYLEQRLKGRNGECLAELLGHFRTAPGEEAAAERPGPQASAHLFALLLGKSISSADLSSPELVERLAASLNTVFDTLNRIIAVINNTLMGREAGGETIRMIIGSHLEGADEVSSLQDYLDQIQKAFLVAHDAFKQAIRHKIGEILDELDPERITGASTRGLKFGPLWKAELFDAYQHAFAVCREYSRSGRLLEDAMREFEKACHKTYGAGARREG
jgi:hypothetical protein